MQRDWESGCACWDMQDLEITLWNRSLIGLIPSPLRLSLAIAQKKGEMPFINNLFWNACLQIPKHYVHCRSVSLKRVCFIGCKTPYNTQGCRKRVGVRVGLQACFFFNKYNLRITLSTSNKTSACFLPGSGMKSVLILVLFEKIIPKLFLSCNCLRAENN